MIPASARQAIVEDLLGGKATPTTTQLVSMVVGSGRGRDLPAIIDSLVQRASASKNLEVAEVRTAVPLTDDQQDRLEAALANATGKQVNLKVVVDPSVLGGIVATVGDTVIDGSVRTRIDQLKAACRRSSQWQSSPSPPATSRRPSRRTSKASSPRSRPAPSVASPRSATASPASRACPDAAVNELLEFEDGTVGLALNLDEGSIGAVVLGNSYDIEEGQTVKATGRILSVPVGDAVLGRVVNALGEPIDGNGEIVGGIPPDRDPGARHHGPQAGARAAADRHQVDRRDDPDRSRPARADHRRPQDRQDHRLRRHDHEPAGSGREVHLRRDRPEGLDGRPDRRDAAPGRCHGVHRRRHRPGQRSGAVQVPRSVRRVRDGPALDGERRARAHRVRRPVEAGRGVPPAVAAAAPAAGPRGVSGRRLLPPQPAARAGRQAQRRARCRFAHRAAGHRDQGRRRVGVHPDQRHLDHRRSGVPAGQPVQVGRASGRRRGHLGVAASVVPRRSRR